MNRNEVTTWTRNDAKLLFSSRPTSVTKHFLLPMYALSPDAYANTLSYRYKSHCTSHARVMKDKIISLFSNDTAETKQKARSADLRPANPARQILLGKIRQANYAKHILP
jgi:hypothetical protein